VSWGVQGRVEARPCVLPRLDQEGRPVVDSQMAGYRAAGFVT